MGDYAVEFRQVRVYRNGEFAFTRWEYRRKMILISILGVELSSWGNWEEVNTVVIDENEV